MIRLKTVRIREFVIVEDQTIEFGSGLNLMTGETGAGKSILVDALGLIAGQRAERSLVRSGAERAVVEAQFELARESAVTDWARRRGIEKELLDEGQVVVRREIAAEGAGRALLNGSPCTTGQLRELGALMLDLHAQHDQYSLTSPDRQRAFLDRLGVPDSLVTEVATAFRAAVVAREQLEELERSAGERRRLVEELEQTVREIEAVAPRPGELAEIDAERLRLQSAAGITALVEELAELIHDGDPSLGALAARGARRSRELAQLDPSVSELAARIEGAALELEEAGSTLRDYRERMEFPDGRLEELESRRVVLERLLLRFGEDEQAVLDRLEEARRELARLEGLDDTLEQARKALTQDEERYAASAARLRVSRRKAARKLQPLVLEQLSALALEKARFEVLVAEASGEKVSDGRGGQICFHPRGADRVEFRLAANPGEPFAPVGRAASGGELSRVMLALHAAGQEALDGRILVFDEVDAGVGGATADAVGARLAELARAGQVLCVTHLPQVAAYADQHYTVRKTVARGRTRASIDMLSSGQRVDELARMLAGKRLTPASRRHASDLLRAVRRDSGGAV